MVKLQMEGKVMIDYLDLVGAVLLLICAVIHGVRWFVIRKDYTVSSFLVVIIQLIASVTFFIAAFMG